ncbi:MAG: biotin--[acetyl-CoA-carboxylase] ligase [Azospira sp.]|jgi:BirA family biotin operon repressor/biotin-[acetyl-CoA-carboxylase] ligase|nr:biotin--[acetyl-CoA-carboxylase] ligase [Azospira sp.]
MPAMSAASIDPVRLKPLLGPLAARFDVDALAEGSSSSDLLLERAARGAPSGSVLVVDRQSAGRGRRGRFWVSSPEASLTFSLLWRFDGGVERLAGLSLAVGVAVADALAALGARGIGLKWPNDVLFAGGKLAGILVELSGDRRGTTAVIGIGLNLLPPPAAAALAAPAPLLPATPPAALADALSALPERHALLAGLLCALAPTLDRFSAGGFAALRDEWQALHAWQDAPVRVLRDGRSEIEGLCRGADLDGALRVETASGVERCLSGDLSLRAA